MTAPESPDTPLCAPVAAVEDASGATEPANACEQPGCIHAVDAQRLYASLMRCWDHGLKAAAPDMIDAMEAHEHLTGCG